LEALTQENQSGHPGMEVNSLAHRTTNKVVTSSNKCVFH
jgi:hypothetical protein